MFLQKRWAFVVLMIWVFLFQGTSSVLAENDFPQKEQVNIFADDLNIKSTIKNYIELRYQSLNTLKQKDFDHLIYHPKQEENFMAEEMSKLDFQIAHAKLNQLRYVKYQIYIDFKSISVNEDQTVTVEVIEGHDVVFEVLQPRISSMRNLHHTIILQKRPDGWKIIRDDYEDILWKMLRSSTSPKNEPLMFNLNEKLLNMRDDEHLPATSAPLTTTGSYNRGGAVNYAHQWAYGRNPAYYDFSNAGGDCTNFVSQAIHEGGNVPETASQSGSGTSGWFYDDVYNRAAAWTHVGSLYNFIVHQHWQVNGPEGYSFWNKNSVIYGDLIQYDWWSDGSWDHSVIAVDSIDMGWGDMMPIVAGHSPNVDNYPYTAFSNPSSERFIRITGY